MNDTLLLGFGGSQLWATRVLLVATHADIAQCRKSTKGEWLMEGEDELIKELQKTFDSDVILVPHFFVLDAHQAWSSDMKQLRHAIAEIKNFLVQVNCSFY